MAWFIPFDAVTIIAVGTIALGLIVGGIVCLLKGAQERAWPETPGEIVDYRQRRNDDVEQYFPTLQLRDPNGQLVEVAATRPMKTRPEVGQQVVVKHHPQGNKVWVKGKTVGTLFQIALTCFVLALAIPLAVLAFVDWSA